MSHCANGRNGKKRGGEMKQKKNNKTTTWSAQAQEAKNMLVTMNAEAK